MKRRFLGIAFHLICLASPLAVCEEGYSSSQPSAPAKIYYRAFTNYSRQDACEISPKVSKLSLKFRSTTLQAGDRINITSPDDSVVSDLIVEAFDAEGNFIPSVPIYVSAGSQGRTKDYDPGVIYKDGSMDYWEARLPGGFDIDAEVACVSDAQHAVRAVLALEVVAADE